MTLCAFGVSRCKGPYGPHGTCCEACVEVHEEKPQPETCQCHDHRVARGERVSWPSMRGALEAKS